MKRERMRRRRGEKKEKITFKDPKVALYYYYSYWCENVILLFYFFLFFIFIETELKSIEETYTVVFVLFCTKFQAVFSLRFAIKLKS